MRNCAIDMFMENHTDFCGLPINRCMYIRMDTEELFVIEEREYKNKRKTFVFKYDCGHFEECRTEVNTFEKYFILIPNSDFTEFMQLKSILYLSPIRTLRNLCSKIFIPPDESLTVTGRNTENLEDFPCSGKPHKKRKGEN